MAGFTDTFEQAVLALLLNGTAIANIADNAAASPATNLYLSLHTSDPGETGSQTTNETAYTGYARQPITRGGWTVGGSGASPTANIDFPQCTASPGAAITHVGIGKSLSGAGSLILSGAITPNIAMAISAIPRISSASTVTLD